MHKDENYNNLINIHDFAPKPEEKNKPTILKKKTLRGQKIINLDGEEITDDHQTFLLRKKLREIQERKERERKLH